jgi:hypothetical protein
MSRAPVFLSFSVYAVLRIILMLNAKFRGFGFCSVWFERKNQTDESCEQAAVAVKSKSSAAMAFVDPSCR